MVGIGFLVNYQIKLRANTQLSAILMILQSGTLWLSMKKFSLFNNLIAARAVLCLYQENHL